MSMRRATVFVRAAPRVSVGAMARSGARMAVGSMVRPMIGQQVASGMRLLSTFRTNADGKRVFTRGEVAQHNSDDDLWVVINERVYDLTVWLNFHPGGREPLLQMAGKGRDYVVVLFFFRLGL